MVEILAEQLRIEVLDANRTSLDVRLGIHLSAGDAGTPRGSVPFGRRSDRGRGRGSHVPDLLVQLTQLMQMPVRLYMTTESVIDELLRRMYGDVGRA